MNLPLGMIEMGTRLRGASQDTVSALAASIGDVGLLNPITVYARPVIRNGIEVDGWALVAGLHRLEACRQLGWEEIPAHVVTLSDLERQIAECDENLCGPKLTPAERAMFTMRRKHAYEALHPETKHGGDRKSSSQSENLNKSFATDTAAKTGQGRSTIARDAMRGSKLDEAVLAEVRGTVMDKGATLDALAAVPRAEQSAKLRQMQEERERATKDARKADRDVVYTEAHRCAEWLKGILDLDETRRLAEWIVMLKPAELSAALLRDETRPVFDNTAFGLP